MNEGKPGCDDCLYDGEPYESPHGYSNCHAPRRVWYVCLKRFSAHPEEYEGDDNDN